MLPSFKMLDAVVSEASVSRKFQEAYSEELLRLRLAVEIRGLRLQRQLTQAELARDANMPQSVIARIEGGKHTISLNTLNRIAQALGKEIHLDMSLGGTITQHGQPAASVASPYSFSSSVINNNVSASFKQYEK